MRDLVKELIETVKETNLYDEELEVDNILDYIGTAEEEHTNCKEKTIACYGTEDEVHDVCIVCEDCNEVIFSFESYKEYLDE